MLSFLKEKNKLIYNHFELAVLLFGMLYFVNACIPLYGHHLLKTAAMYIFVSLVSALIVQKKILIDTHTVDVSMFFLIWLTYGILSLFWARNPDKVLAYSIRNLHYVFIMFFFIQLYSHKYFAKYIRFFFFFMTILLIIISLWEMINWIHLPTSRFIKKNVITFIPTGVFSNENDLASAFVCYIPMILFYLKKSSNVIKKIALIIMLLYFFIVFIVASARLALIASSLILFVYWCFFTNKKTKLITILVVLILLGLFIVEFKEYFDLVVLLAKDAIVSLTADNESIFTSSIEIRLRLFKIGFRFLTNSGLIGIGHGNFASYMNLTEMVETGGIFDPHNLFLEIGVNDGLLLLIAFIYVFFKQLVMYILEYRRNNSETALMYIIMGFCFLIAASVSSSISVYYLFWIYLFYFLFGYREMEYEKKHNYHK